ncbi:TrkH-domain-containing protein, partial [Rhizodiscina lignyota]
MTLAGLNTVNLSQLNTWQQFMLFVLIMMGSTVFVSAFVVHVRRNAFEDRFLSEIDLERRIRRRKTLLPLSRTLTRARTFSRPVTLQRDPEANKLNGTPRLRNIPEQAEGTESQELHHHFFTSGVLARNSTFHHMSEDDRERLGGIEYKAVRLLAWLVPAYFIAWQLLGCIGLGAYITNDRSAATRENGLNPWWTGAFNAVSAFNNSGMSLLDANMVAFQDSVYMLLSMSLFILAGNTCYPVFLRLIIWAMWRLCPNDARGRVDDFKCTLRFLLDHPRRVYTNLFPSRETWWLFATVIVLNGVDCAMFSILNIGNKAITHLSPGIEFLDGLFQAFAVRSGGFYVVPIPSTRISLQVLYVVMMYISVYPVVITIRNSNVYEERSLGIYADDPAGSPDTNHKHEKSYFVQQQLRAQLAHDLWWLVLAIWLITIIEGGQFERDPADFSVFNVIFEVVSGYATVGISVGVPNNAYSFSGSWHVLSKLILCAVMIRGRHRGLPVAIDKAVMLPRD